MFSYDYLHHSYPKLQNNTSQTPPVLSDGKKGLCVPMSRSPSHLSSSVSNLKLRSGHEPTSSSGLYFPSSLPRMLINEGNELLSYIYYRYICKCLIHTRSLHDTYGNLGSENLGDLLKVTKLVISGFGVNLGLIPKKTYALRRRIVTKDSQQI